MKWRKGTIMIPMEGKHKIVAKYEVKQYEKGSKYGINGGRISKLWVTMENKTVINYDRGWDIEPKTEEEQICLSILLNDYN